MLFVFTEYNTALNLWRITIKKQKIDNFSFKFMMANYNLWKEYYVG